MIFGVLAQVAVSAGFENFLGELAAKLMFERGDFLFQFFSGRPAWRLSFCAPL